MTARAVLSPPETRRPGTDRGLAVLIGAELLGALGVESFNILVVWHFVKALGAGSAYYLATMLFTAVVSGILGAGVFDRFRPFACAATLNALRVFAAAGVLLVLANGLPVGFIMLCCVCMSATRPHLDSAIFGGLATFGLEGVTLQRANAAVDNAARIARIAGPALAAIFAWVASETSALLFTITSFSLACALLRSLNGRRVEQGLASGGWQPNSIFAAISRGIALVAKSKTLVYCVVAQMLNSGAWYVGSVFCTALMFTNLSGGASTGMGSFALASLCYGIGNILGNIVTSRLDMTRPVLFIVVGRLMAASGYLALALLNQHVAGICVCAVVIAAGTPPADLSYLRILQSRFDGGDVTRLYRVKMVAEYSGMLLAMLGAPGLLRLTSLSGVVAACGTLLGAIGLLGLLFYRTLRAA